jgi:hypothetical protein
MLVIFILLGFLLGVAFLIVSTGYFGSYHEFFEDDEEQFVIMGVDSELDRLISELDPKDPGFKRRRKRITEQYYYQQNVDADRKTLFEVHKSHSLRDKIQPVPGYRDVLQALKPYRVLLLAGDEDISLIKQLFRHTAYTNYLQLEKFSAYQTIPSMINDRPVLLKQLQRLLSAQEFDVCLFSWQHMAWSDDQKDILASVFTAEVLQGLQKAEYIDIGPGILALTGSVSLARPDFRHWVNFRLQDYKYSPVHQQEYMGESAIILSKGTSTVMWLSSTHNTSFGEYLTSELGYTIDRTKSREWKEMYIYTTSRFQNDRPPFPVTDMQPGVLYVAPDFIGCTSFWIWELFTEQVSFDVKLLRERLEPLYVFVKDMKT